MDQVYQKIGARHCKVIHFYIPTLIITNVKHAVDIYLLFFLLFQNSEKYYIFYPTLISRSLSLLSNFRYSAKYFTDMVIRSFAGCCLVHSCFE
jgi:hypothetical protein